MTRQTLRDRWLLMQIEAIGRLQRVARATRERIARAREESGQTPTEYLMIVGLMAVVIITVFVFFYWNTVKGAAKTWVNNVKQSVLGQPIMP